MNKKDISIEKAMERIHEITTRNLRRVSDDLWNIADATGSVRDGKNDYRDETLEKQLEVLEKLTDNQLKMDSLYRWNNDSKPSENKNVAKEAKTEATVAPKEENKQEEPPEKLEDILKELNECIGLDSIKKEVENLVNLVKVHELRKNAGLPTVDMSLHMVFSGNPGTGKTMIARIMARIYKSLGILSKGQLVEVDRSGLVAGYVGQTATKTQEVINKALGGVLFIDEAYALTYHKEANDFGQEAVDTLLKAMEDNRDDLIVIVAGYDGLMQEFIHSNPGLESRFNRYLHFEDYTMEEMLGIFRMRCDKGGYVLDDDATDEVEDFIKKQNVDPITFGNARGVRNLFEQVLVAQANRVVSIENVTKEQLMQLTAEDVLKATETAVVKEKREENPEEALNELLSQLKERTDTNQPKE